MGRWVPAFLQVLPDHLEAYRQTGYQVLKLGEEALVDLAGFDLVWRQWRDIRQARNRLQLANVGVEGKTDLPHRAGRFLYLRFNRFCNFQGLRAFKEKFNPRWEPRYLVYPSAPVVPRVALAALRAGSTRGLVGFLRQAGSSGSRYSTRASSS